MSSSSEIDETETADNEAEIRDVSAPPRKKLLKEAMRDIFVSTLLVILTILITQADFQKSPTSSLLASDPKTRNSRSPRPLFGGQNSYIDDYFTGDIFAAFEEANNYENALIMFYSPWDTDCIRTVDLLETVAKTFIDNDVYFAAVNCWEPNGECNKEFNGEKGKSAKNPRLAQHQYPIFVFYPNDRRGIQYHGPISVQGLLEFLILARKPYLSIGSKHDLSQLRASHSGKALIGYFPDLMISSSSRRAFKKFVDASFQLLEFDPFLQNTGGIGVVTSPQLAFHLQLDASRPVRYFHWNGTTIAFPNKTISSPQSLVSWTRGQIGVNFITWIGSTGRKSLSLAKRLETGTQNSLIVFVNRQNSLVYSRIQHLVEEIALQYSICDPQVEAYQLFDSIHNRHRDMYSNQNHLLNECLKDPWFVEIFGQDFSIESKNTSVQHQLRRLKRKWFSGQPLVDSQVVEVGRMSQRLNCAVMASSGLYCDDQQGQEEEEGGEVGDEQLRQHHDVFDEHQPAFVWSLSCRDNRTLNFYLMDKVTQWSFLPHLGLHDELDNLNKANAIIVSLQDETVYVMEDLLSVESLESFVQTFHENVNQLKVLKQSKVLDEIEQAEQKSAGMKTGTGEDTPTVEEKEDDDAITEVNVGNFAQTIAEATETRSVVVLYTSPSCAFCQVATHIFHTLERLISSDLVNFLTIDSTQNDLPWSFTALAVPSVLYFHPRSSKHGGNLTETRAFPAEKPLSVANLLSFIVANLEPQSRIKLALSLCGEDCITEAKVKLAKEYPYMDPKLSLIQILEPLLKNHDEL